MKRITALFIVGVFFILMLPVQVSAQGKYISYIAVTDGLSIDDPEDTLEAYGYNVIWTDLNLGTSDGHLLLGYKTTDDYDKALKDIVIAEGDDAVDDALTKNYSATSEEKIGTDLDDDLNEGAGGADLWLLGSYETTAGAPITDIYVKEGIEPPDDSGWEVVNYYNSTEAADMNKDAGGAYLYLFVKRDYDVEPPVNTQNQGAENAKDEGPVGGKYISYIAVTDGLVFDDPEQTLEEYGYTVIWTDLNLGTGGDDLLMGYKTTSDYDKALKSIVIAEGAVAMNDAYLEGYYSTSEELDGDDFDDDLNEGGGGAYLKLIGSRDSTMGAPIIDICVKEGIEPPDNSGWEVVNFYNSTEAADLNKDAGGAYLYLFVKRETSLTASVFAEGSLWLLLVGAGVIVVAGVVTTIVVTNKKKKAAASAKAD